MNANDLLAEVDATFETLNIDLVEAGDAGRSAAVAPDVRAEMERLIGGVRTLSDFVAAFERIVGLVTTDNRQLAVALSVVRPKLKAFATPSSPRGLP